MIKSLQVCGTSGSGKTTLVRQLYEESNCEPIIWLDTKTKTPTMLVTSKPLVSVGEHPDLGRIFVLGSYATVCGGCDTIPSVKIVAQALRDLDASYNGGICVFEGLMISHMIGTVGEAQKELGVERHWRAYLDTELSQCLENVLARRKARGQTKPFNPANTQADWPRVRQSRSNWITQGGTAVNISYENAWSDFLTNLWDLRNA